MTFAGSRYYPISALVCLSATSSSLISGVCGSLVTDPVEKTLIGAVAALFGMVLFGTSAVALVSLLVCGSEDVGGMVIRGRTLTATAVWAGYLVIFLLPWLGMLGMVFRI